MNRLLSSCRVTIAALTLTSGVLFLGSTQAAAQSTRVEVTGDYRYTFHDPMLLADAKVLACEEALRLAVANSPVVREETASLVDSAAYRDLIQLLVSSYVSDLQIVEHAEKGRTVYCKVKGALQTDEVQRAARSYLLSVSNGKQAPALDQNRVLQIVNVRDESGYLVVTYRALKRLDWIGTAYQGSLRESADLMVDFLDEQGSLIRTDRYPAHRTPTGDDVMNPGEVGIRKIIKPSSAKAYRVWLVK